MKFDNAALWAKRRDIPIAILAWLLVAILIFWLLGHISHTIILLVIASLIAYALVPAVGFFEKFLPRFLAILTVYVLVFSGLGVVLYMVIDTGVRQLTLLSNNIQILLTPNNYAQSSPLASSLQGLGISPEQLQVFARQLTTYAESLLNSIFPLLTSVFTTLLDTLIIGILSIYLLFSGEKIVSWIHHNIPTRQQKLVEFFLNTLQQVMGGYIRGQLLMSAIIGVLVGIGMTLFNVPYAVLLGILAFILAFIPILGTFISGAACILLALTNGVTIAFFVLIYFIVIHIIEGDIVGPRIVGNALGIHPIISMLALIAGSELYGVVGAIFAAPLAGIGQAILVSVWLEWKKTHQESFKRNIH
jgi:predicted PurR-regulated permease PerM